MKRFYCTVCKKVKRVRKFPQSIEGISNVFPVDRIGQCDYHSLGVHHTHTPKREYVKKVKVVKQPVSRKRAS